MYVSTHCPSVLLHPLLETVWVSCQSKSCTQMVQEANSLLFSWVTLDFNFRLPHRPLGSLRHFIFTSLFTAPALLLAILSLHNKFKLK